MMTVFVASLNCTEVSMYANVFSVEQDFIMGNIKIKQVSGYNEKEIILYTKDIREMKITKE